MKITKAMGRACLAELADCEVRQEVTDALDELGGGEPYYGMDNEAFETTLAMCAAIAGVKPEGA